MYWGRWRKESKAYLQQNFWCVCEECKATDRPKQANVVDHKIPHRGNPSIFWDATNWQAMNKACHDKKTVREDGGLAKQRRI